MTQEMLRQILEEAKKNKQIGLLIWGSLAQWKDCSCQMKQENEFYESALNDVANGKEAMIILQWNGCRLPGILAVPVQKTTSSDDSIQEILDLCEIFGLKGPITLLPSNNLSKYCKQV